MSLDVTAYLDQKHIPFITSGKNVSTGWVGIRCVFCDDLSDHLGINKTSGYYSCWKCGATGPFVKLIMVLEPCNYATARRVLQNYESHDTIIPVVNPLPTRLTCALPSTACTTLPKAHRRYLVRRGFNPAYLATYYGIMACHTVGTYRYRVIIPIYIDNQLVNFVARDVTGNFEKKYLMPPSDVVAVPRKYLLYNYDRMGQSVILTEGIFDAWRIGLDAVATLGTKVTEEQCALLARKHVKRLFICFDSDAVDHGRKLAAKLSYLIPHVEAIEIPYGDPDSYFKAHPDELRQLRGLL